MSKDRQDTSFRNHVWNRLCKVGYVEWDKVYRRHIRCQDKLPISFKEALSAYEMRGEIIKKSNHIKNKTVKRRFKRKPSHSGGAKARSNLPAKIRIEHGQGTSNEIEFHSSRVAANFLDDDMYFTDFTESDDSTDEKND